MKNKYLWIGGSIFVILVGALMLGLSLSAAAGVSLEGVQQGEAVLYKSATCGCCGVYSQYLMNFGTKLQIVNTDIQIIKDQNKIPAALSSCHTTIIDGYFVEGHIPTEAIKKLLTERPDIKGIAMPGMPSGTPGMPGSKKESWVIYAVKNDGSYEEYMRI